MIHRIVFFAILIAWGAISTAEGTQHLVSPGESWSDLGPRLEPGDEIILLPGKHRGVRFIGVAGTEKRPIVIRSADPDQPGVIQDQRVGVYLRNCRHFVLRDFSVSRSSLCGIRIENDVDDQEGAESVDRGFVLERLRISDIGKGRGRQGMQFIGVTNIQVAECVVKDWGGSAIDLKGCAKVVLTGSTFAMSEKRQSGGGILVRDGSSDIQIRRCRLKDAGAWAIQLGESDADSGVRDIMIADTLVIGGGGTGAAGGGCKLVRVENGIIRRNSFVNLRGSILEIEGVAAAIRSIRFASNLISWSSDEHGVPVSRAKGGEVLPRESLIVQANLWWDGQRDPQQPLPEFPLVDAEPQVWDIDPDLDEKHFLPRNLRAGLYGVSPN